jgi:hypothetical protein
MIEPSLDEKIIQNQNYNALSGIMIFCREVQKYREVQDYAAIKLAA